MTNKLVDRLQAGVSIRGFQCVDTSRVVVEECPHLTSPTPVRAGARVLWLGLRYQPIKVAVTSKTGGSNFWMDMTLKEGKVRCWHWCQGCRPTL